MSAQKGKIANWIIFTIILALLFGLLLFFQSRQEVDEGRPPSPETVEKVTKITKPRKKFAVPELTEGQKEEADNDAFNSAILSGKGCDEIKYNPELKQKCLDTLAYNEALSKNDETICKQIKDDELRQKCIDQVFLSLAINSSDKKLCDQIKDKDTKQNCLDQINVLAGRTAESAADCKVVKDLALRQTCLDNFYLEQSAKNLDEDGCNSINDTDMKTRCVEIVQRKVEIAEAAKKQAVRTFETTEEKLKTCDTLEGEAASGCKDDANFNLAFEKLDLTYCNAINDTAQQQNCIETQSVTINNLYLKQALITNNSSLCQKIIDDDLRSSCLSNF